MRRRVLHHLSCRTWKGVQDRVAGLRGVWYISVRIKRTPPAFDVPAPMSIAQPPSRHADLGGPLLGLGRAGRLQAKLGHDLSVKSSQKPAYADMFSTRMC